MTSFVSYLYDCAESVYNRWSEVAIDHYTALLVNNMAQPQLELHLISVSSTVGEPAECDLVFRLGDQKSSNLPNPAQCSAWEGRTISPLRDRYGRPTRLSDTVGYCVWRIAN